MSTLSSVVNDPVTREGNVFRGTNRHKGRKVFITPENSTMQHLCYARILLDKSHSEAQFGNGNQETALICLAGEAHVEAAGQTFTLSEHDSAYIPRDSSIRIRTDSGVDIAEFAADVAEKYPLQIVRYSDVKDDKSLHFSAGGPATTRDLNILIGKNVQAGRLLAGLTISEPGNWTSWPPHEHGAMLEEMYVYTHMPPPGFGVQFVYTDTKEPELATIVRDGDAVLMPRGYHPNVAAPGHRIGFLWAMAAHREKEDRQFGVVNVQPEFSQAGSGLEASRK
ncbi:MAG: 5-deoxy-glucuronate isomerase [Acidobacteria bacterium]|nr:5-deoxy-glucuronate isomerase [Acidobacteriota bacterium]MBV9434489.1 5-deoxy-glucuronate isomerase [Acidobacteriota bacterium]